MRNGNKTTKLVDSSALSCNSKYHFLFARFDASYGAAWHDLACVCVCVCLFSAGREIHHEAIHHGVWPLSRLDHPLAYFIHLYTTCTAIHCRVFVRPRSLLYVNSHFQICALQISAMSSFREIVSEMPTLHTQHEQQKYTFNHRSCIILLSQKNALLLLLTLGHLGILWASSSVNFAS